MKTRFTLVQHSGFGYGNNPQFEKAVEIRSIDLKPQEKKVEKVGGLLFDDYTEASDMEDKINGVNGDRPFLQAAGTFSDEEIDQLRIYIPKREVVG